MTTLRTATKPVSFYCALVVRKALEAEVLPAFRATHDIIVDEALDPTTVLRQRIEAGERPDVIIAVTKALGPILATGAIAPVTQLPFVRSGMGELSRFLRSAAAQRAYLAAGLQILRST